MYQMGVFERLTFQADLVIACYNDRYSCYKRPRVHHILGQIGWEYIYDQDVPELATYNEILFNECRTN